MVMFLTGSFHLKTLELGRPEIRYLFVISLLKSVVPVELRSCSLGKAWKLSLSQQDRGHTEVGQLAVLRVCPPLVWHYNGKCQCVDQLVFNCIYIIAV